LRATRASIPSSIGFMLAIGQLLVLASFLPRVENPWPGTIGIELPFAMAGAGGALAGFLYSGDSKAGRDGAVRRGGLWGFRLGVTFYVLSFLNQVASS
jgi:hypothetical protein